MTKNLKTFNNETLHKMFHSCRVSIPVARELSWRDFYSKTGGKEGALKLEGTKKLPKLLRKSEDCFLSILENKIEEKRLRELIALPPTDVWIRDYSNRSIRIKAKSEM